MESDGIRESGDSGDGATKVYRFASVKNMLTCTSTHLVSINLFEDWCGLINIVEAGTGVVCWYSADNVLDEYRLT